MKNNRDHTTQYDEGSLMLAGTVMFGTGIFALTGQMAEMKGALFPLAFLDAAVIVSFSVFTYNKISNTYPSAGGIGEFLYLRSSAAGRTSQGYTHKHHPNTRRKR